MAWNEPGNRGESPWGKKRPAGESGSLGKPAGHDLREGTITLPVINYLASNAGSDSTRETIATIVEGRADDATTDQTISAIRESGAIEAAFADAQARVESALERLEFINDSRARGQLEEFAQLALQRST